MLAVHRDCILALAARPHALLAQLVVALGNISAAFVRPLPHPLVLAAVPAPIPVLVARPHALLAQPVAPLGNISAALAPRPRLPSVLPAQVELILLLLGLSRPVQRVSQAVPSDIISLALVLRFQHPHARVQLRSSISMQLL